MKYLLAITLLISFHGHSKELNAIEAEYVISINDTKISINEGKSKKVYIEGKETDVKLELTEHKVFNNYGIKFSVPNKTSAYLDERTEDMDFWNFDFHESSLILIVLNEGNIDFDQSILQTQLESFANSLGAKISSSKKVSNYTGIEGLGAVGLLGKHNFLFEQYGFSNKEYSFMMFTYSPIIERSNRDIEKKYKDFKSLIFNSLEK